MPQIQNMRQATVNASTIGSNAIVLAPGSTNLNPGTTTPTAAGGLQVGAITVWAMNLEAAGANVLQFQSAANNTGGPITFTAAGQTEVLPYTGAPWVKCAAGQALNLVLTTTAAITGTIYYTLG